jgi:hypothetical protein
MSAPPGYAESPSARKCRTLCTASQQVVAAPHQLPATPDEGCCQAQPAHHATIFKVETPSKRPQTRTCQVPGLQGWIKPNPNPLNPEGQLAAAQLGRVARHGTSAHTAHCAALTVMGRQGTVCTTMHREKASTTGNMRHCRHAAGQDTAPSHQTGGKHCRAASQPAAPQTSESIFTDRDRRGTCASQLFPTLPLTATPTTTTRIRTHVGRSMALSSAVCVQLSAHLQG